MEKIVHHDKTIHQKFYQFNYFVSYSIALAQIKAVKWLSLLCQLFNFVNVFIQHISWFFFCFSLVILALDLLCFSRSHIKLKWYNPTGRQCLLIAFTWFNWMNAHRPQKQFAFYFVVYLFCFIRFFFYLFRLKIAVTRTRNHGYEKSTHKTRFCVHHNRLFESNWIRDS